jgi:hypothetical protein
MVDYDGAHNAPGHSNGQVVFYPYGSVSSTPLANTGTLLVYYPGGSGGFTNTANFVTVDLTSISIDGSVHPYAFNFGGGFTDGAEAFNTISSTANYAYLPVGPRNTVLGTIPSQGSDTVQINLAYLASDPQNTGGNTYHIIDLNAVFPTYASAMGNFAGVYANGSAYYCPTITNQGAQTSNYLIRYNSALGAFNSSSSWQIYNLSNIPGGDTTLGGCQSAASIGNTVYLIPFCAGKISTGLMTGTKLIAYDSTKSFSNSGGNSYQFIDLSKLYPGAPASINQHLGGFTGGVVVGGRYLLMIPWGVRNTQITNSVACLYDSELALTSSSAYQCFDLTNVNAKAAGYQFGWIDQWGMVGLAPTHNYNTVQNPTIPPFLVWNTAYPFATASSWNSYTNVGYNGTPGSCAIGSSGCGVWFSGATYDAATNKAYLAPYGVPPTSSPVENAYMLEITESYTPPTTSPLISITGLIQIVGAAIGWI